MLTVVLWVLLPAGFANAAPVIAARLLPLWDWPVDFGWSLQGKRIFGAHKTWRGMLAGLVAGAAGAAMLRWSCGSFPVIGSPADLGLGWWPPIFGAWIGLGALIGDLVKSFLKRRIGIPPGATWFPFDQLDWLFGALGFASLVMDLSAASFVAVLLGGAALHVIGHALGYLLRLNRSWI